ncbi:Rieske Fe-S protein [Streptomyces sp. SAI-144]|uniref:Rieske (2Fe-2S) protein n=1 Tax=Streptomyces sp. SAI-144 TaxID=2940544 RepID=UPI0024739D2C|nr:Rieske (2Fe-2S) protein [Streptomyces sp. SAI-144]MDH6436343.1 Rieske Fe-S protein [Streptomyces sp. SAI-144]
MAEPSGIAGPRTRRNVMAGAGAAGLAAALSACGTKEKERGPDLSPGQDGSPPSQSGEPSAAPSGTSGGGAALGKASDVPVGGGLVDRDAKVVVTQPTEGDFKAFSAVCTHQGCPVTSVENGAIVCPCHKSRFAIADGKVISGPAPRPLPSTDITVTDGTIRLA